MRKAASVQLKIMTGMAVILGRIAGDIYGEIQKNMQTTMELKNISGGFIVGH